MYCQSLLGSGPESIADIPAGVLQISAEANLQGKCSSVDAVPRTQSLHGFAFFAGMLRHFDPTVGTPCQYIVGFRKISRPVK